MVKKAAQASPNLLLRRARLERGWTQQMVADRIGAPNNVMVARWESGTTSPSTYYVERLCRLFERRASDLGLLQERRATTSRQVPDGGSRPDAPENGSSTTGMPRHQGAAALSQLPLIGRVAEARALHDVYSAVRQGQLQAVILQGEAGIGKTHFASAFLRWAATQGATLLQGRAIEMGGRLPYQPLAHALGRHLEQEPALEALLGAPWLSELSRLLPELRERYPHLPVAPGDEATARLRLFEALTRLGLALSARGPIVLFIDDLQWADTASLDVLHYAGQRWSESGTPILLLLAARSEALAASSPLGRWLAGLHRDLPVTDLVLGPFTEDETLQMLDALGTGHTLAGDRDRYTDLGQWLFHETHGQPFYLVETLNLLLERQILRLHRTAQGAELAVDLPALHEARQHGVFPPGVRQLILAHQEQLTAPARALLQASAILGQRGSFDMLRRVADLEEQPALAGMEEVLRCRLLCEISAEDVSAVGGQHVALYDAVHDKVREVVYAEMGEAWRHHLHRRVLAVLESLRRPAAELAHHALAAGPAERAWQLNVMAGDEAVLLFANADAQLHYDQALQALARLPDAEGSQRHRVETILRLVQVSWMTADAAQTLARLAEAERLAQTLSDRKQLALVHYWTGLTSSMRKTTRQTLAYARQVLDEARALEDDELVALASVQLGRQLILQGCYDSIERLLVPAIPILERTANMPDWTHALGLLGIARAGRGEYAAGLALGQRALERARRAGSMKSRNGIGCHFYLSRMHMFGGEYLWMLEEISRVIEGAHQLGDWIYLYLGYGLRGWAESRLGRHKEAMQSMARSQAAGERLGERHLFEDIFAAATAEISLAAGRVEEGLARAEAAVALARAVGGILSEGLAQRVWGQALASHSNWEEAEMHLSASVQALLAGGVLVEAARSQVAWGVLCRDRGDLASAQQHFALAAAHFAASGLIGDLETVRRYQSA
jgi:transcriptional regulator with XRE-family HTH domain/tetratricopeptide (TPR) repeat protein